jgi:hypothetical protein
MINFRVKFFEYSKGFSIFLHKKKISLIFREESKFFFDFVL